MSISRRNRFLGVYAYSSVTIEGVATDMWTLSTSAWGRVDPTQTRQPIVSGVPSTTVTAVVQLSDDITVPANGVIVDGTTLNAATAFHIRGVRPRTDRHVQYVDVEQFDRNTVDFSALLIDGAFILDGSSIFSGVGP